MRALLTTGLLACLTLLSSPPLEAQSGRATGTARGTVGGALGTGGSVRGMPSVRGRATGALSGGVFRGTGGSHLTGVRIRVGLPAPRMPSHYDPFYWPYDPYRYGWVRPGYARGRVTHAWRGYPHFGFFAGLHFPLVYYYPVATTRVVHVQSGAVGATAVAGEAAPGMLPPTAATPPVEGCAIVTVLQPGQRGFWKELRLPAMGAHNTDELQRVLDARAEEGMAFSIRDASGEELAIPARADLDRIVVHPCR